MAWAWEQPVTSAPKLVLMAIADQANDEGCVWLSLDRLAFKSSQTRRTVQRHIQVLSQKPYGLLSVVHRFDESGRQTVSSYRLHLELACHPGLQPDLSPPTSCGEGDKLTPWGEGDNSQGGRVTNRAGEGVNLSPPTLREEREEREEKKDKEREEKTPQTPQYPSLSPPPQGVVDRFKEFWAAYPSRNGKKLELAETRRRFLLLSIADQALAVTAARHYAASQLVRDGKATKDPKRFLRDGAGNEPWRDWMTPEVPHRPGADKLARALSWKPPELREKQP